LATIAVLSQTFGYSDSPELAVSCGMLLWLVTFMSVIPAGLILAQREHVSLRRLTVASQQEEGAAEEALSHPGNGRSA
jgi:glycosyltransferase 2 family protein